MTPSVLAARTAGVIGTGRTGAIVARILHAFGCEGLAHDVAPSEACLTIGAQIMSMSSGFRTGAPAPARWLYDQEEASEFIRSSA